MSESSTTRPGGGTARHQSVPALAACARTEELPLSFAQQRLWFIDQLEPGGASYNVCFLFELRGALNTAALGGALQDVVQRHEVLRTRFPEVLGHAKQVIDPTLEVPFSVESIEDVAEDARPEAAQEAVHERARQEALRPFDLATGPLIRAKLLRRAEDAHALVLVMHHIVCDDWSVGVLVTELSAAYRVRVDPSTLPLPSLPLQYADFAVWQRRRLAGAELERAMDYWKRTLGDAPAALDLPTDHPRPVLRSGRGARSQLELPAELVNAIAALSRKEGVTRFMTLLAAFDTLLWRYSGQADIVVATPISGRNRREIEPLIGFFANTLALRVLVDGGLSFRALLQRVRAVCLDAYTHQDAPFESVVDVLQPERDLSRTPLFQVMFVMRNTPFPRVEIGESTLEPAVLDVGTSPFDLTLLLMERTGRLTGWFEYNTDLYDAATIERMTGHYLVLLEAAVIAPDARLGALPLLGHAERHTVVEAWNCTATPSPGHTSVIELFHDQVRRTPDAIAIAAGDVELSYRELDARAEAWAAALRARGCGPDTRVALALTRSHAFPLMTLAVLKAGAAYVPLDPSYPHERLAFMLADCGARVLATESAVAARLPAHAVEVLLVDAPPPPVPDDVARESATQDSLVYVIYTSGSTGQPKGVAMPQRAVLNLLMHQCAASPARLRTLHFASPSFDVSFQELFSTWANGGCVVVASEEARRDPFELLHVCREERIERLFLPFVALHQLAEAARGRDMADLALREVITAGEQLRITPAIAALFTQLPECRLYNQYGPTETHLATQFALVGAPASWDALPPIGRPIGNVRVYVLDAELQPVPIGVPGELYIGGAGVALGYVGRTELTAQRFVLDPFGAPGSRMYRTGDRANYLPSGDLVFLGRADDQVKVRGYRIEPGEIEAVLGAHPAVSAAAVVARGDAGDTRLIAYVACVDGSAMTGAALKNHLRARLPEYMVPAAIVILPALPLSPNGKVDRRALPRPALERPVHVAPRTPMEELVARLWEQLLGVANLGPTESFFEVGGHSLLATQVISRLRAALGVDLPVRALFEAPTLAEFARRLEAETTRSAAGSPVIAPAIPPLGRTGPLPLSFAQQRLWFLDQLEPGGFAYNVPYFLCLTGPLDVVALERSLGEVMARHQVLRARFCEVDGEALQSVADQRVALEIEPVSEHDIAERARREARQPFDLATGPPIRVRLLRVTDREHVLLVVMHHIACDGWSMAILVRELGAAYRAFATGARPELPELEIQYTDFAEWQRQWLTPDVLDRQVAYWTRALADAPAILELPTDRPRPARRTVRGAAVTRVLGGELAAAVRALSQKEGVTEFMTLLAGFAALLGRYSGQQDVVVGSPIAGRNWPEVEGLIGFFVNTLVLRVPLDGEPSFRAVLGRAREVCLEAYAHQDLPFEKLVDAMKPDRDPSRTPLFQVMFALQNAPAAELGVAELTVSPLDIHPGMARFDLTLFLQPGRDGIVSTWEYNTDLFDATTIERMAGHYASLLERLVGDPEQRPATVALVSADERARLLEQGTVRAAYPELESLHALFEAEVARAPDATAMVFGEARLSYAVLNARANRLARYLAARGVGREDRVGLCLGRSVDFVVSMLAAIKAGACYVPLDPSYPVERLAYMAADAGVRVVIARRGAGAAELADREIAGTPVWLDEAEAELSRLSDANLPVIATARDLGYVMYTSGSTGRPKGTCIEQRSIARLVLGTDYVQIEARDVVAHLSNTSFDASTFEMWSALLNGATLHGIASDIVMSPEALAREFADAGITAAVFTSALFHQVVAEVPSAFCAARHVLVGGDVLDPAAVRRILAAGPPRRLINGYGPTEATTFASWHVVTDVDACGPTVPIGRPIANTTIRILDVHRNLVPVGVRGEIYIGGPGVARGYWNRPELTDECFVADPFEPGERLYRTGDLGSWRSDGVIEFHGRADDQVKLRGFRIELGEIETQLLAGGELAAATVIVRDDTGDRRLVAYVVPRAAVAPDVEAIRARIAAVLPRYMLPSAIVVLDHMPMTPNGKLDRRALPAPSARGEVRAAPRTAMEEILGEIWQRVLKQDRIDAQDSFFELGGHSLLAMQVLSRIRGTLGVAVPVQRLFEAPTLAAFARAVDAEMSGAAAQPGARLLPARRPARLPLSSAQQRLWFLDRLDPGGFSYNVPVFVRLTGSLDIDALAHSLDDVIRRHEVLRTRFVETDGTPEQVIDPPWPTSERAHSLEVERLAVGDDVQSWSVREGRRPFSLADGPLIRGKLLVLGPDDHVLAILMHHIVCDGWSIGILMRELRDLYRARLAGTEPALPALALQYADVAIHQRELSDEVVAGQLAYWTEQLAGAPELLELPTDRMRPTVHTTRGALVHAALPPAVTAAVRDLSRRSGVTTFMTLLAGYYALLHRYSGQSDLVVGSPTAGRHHQELEDLIGFFVNSLALRVQIDGGLSFQGLLARVRDVCLRAQAHQDVPFERVVQAVRPGRDASHTPLFQVMCALHDATGRLDLPGVSGQGMFVHPGMAKVDLTLSFQDTGDELRAYWEYNTDLFDAATVERMAAHYVSLLERMVGDPEQRPATVALVSADERARLLEQGTVRAAYPELESLHTLFEVEVARAPDATAMVFGEARLSYTELNARANQLARYLAARGVGREDRVGLCLGRSVDFVVSVLAAIKAGACYVPLDPSYPVERLAYMAADAGVRVVIARRAVAAIAADLTGTPVWLDEAEAELSQMSDANPPVIANARDLGYVMYTSGSTGRPKGTCIEQRSIARLVLGTDYGQIDRDDVVAHLSNTSFDAATFEIWGALLNGATLHGIAPDVVLSPQDFARAIADGGITTVLVTTALFHQIAAETPSAFHATTHAFVGGDVLDPAAVRRVLAAGPPRQLINLYGPTEATTVATWHLVTDADAQAVKVPIGRPIANTTVRILDVHRNLVPVGVRGEIYIGGPGVARGYWNRPELTDERFVADPLEPGERLYRTGDLGSWRSDGVIELHGRADDQVKLRGFRIELGEIEVQLLAGGELAAATVVVRDDTGDRRLVAYVVPRAAVALDVEAIRARIAAVLPRYMLPSAIVVLDQMPMTPNGKLDRRALPAPSARGEVRAAPRTAMEEILGEIWQRVLKQDRIDAQDSFFELGGHSLLAMQVLSRIRGTLGVAVPVQRLFEAPTLAAFARAVDAEMSGAAAQPGARLLPARRPARLPLSSAQQRLWFLDRLDPGGFSYNVPVFVRLTGSLDIDALAHSLDDVIRRHEVLRTRFVETDGTPEQVIDPPWPTSERAHSLEVERLAVGDDVQSWSVREGRRPFSLADGPLIRGKLLVLGPDDHVLAILMHHIVCDGWSIGILMRELRDLYRARLAGTEPALPALALQYADVAIHQRELSDEVVAGQLAYWTEQLAGAPELLELPTDRMRPTVHTTRGALVHAALPPAVTAAVRDLSRRSGVTTFMTLLAGYYALLHRYSGQSDLVVGSPTAGRHHQELEDLIGFFVNSLALRVQIDGGLSFQGLLARVRDVCLRAQAHQDVPFERVVQAVRPGRDASHTPLFQVMCALHDATGRLDLPGVSGQGMFVHPGMAKVDLTLSFQDTGDELRAYWEYNTDLFDAATVERMAAHYVSLLERMVGDPEQRPATVALTSADERARLLEQGTVRAAYPELESLHTLFEAEVARAPDATAMVFGEARLSYAELNARANQLARYLAARGVGREDRVGLCLGRSVDFVVSVLAAIKAGACYVPLDPSYPVERLAYMAADAGVRVVIARRAVAAIAADLTGTPVWLDEAEAELSQMSDANPPVIANARDLGYLMYTSGSTGRPKGTCIEQRSIARLVLGTDYGQIDRDDVVAHLSNTSFDAATFEIWGALLNGATLHGIAPDVVLSPQDFARAIADGGITTVLVTTALFHQIAAETPSAFHATTHTFVGGDVLDPAAVRRVLAAGPPRQLINLYGPTEATTVATWHLVTDADAQAVKVPIGRPIANTTIRILDVHRNLVPVGVRGEIYIGGPGVARGYWNRPELTDERFVADPLEPGERLYRTGDLGSWRSDGVIELHGRADDQVKLRGFRIELGEIEVQLLAGGELAAATVVVRDDTGDRRLVAYVVPRAAVALDVEAIRARIAAVLPRYMLPSAIVVLDQMPMTPNGKLDRRALPAPSARRADLGGSYLAPEGDLEQSISRIWAEVLGLDRISATDNFFELGGNSLLLLSVQSRLRALLGRPVPVAVLFQHAQVRSLSAHLAGNGGASVPPASSAHRAAGARRLADQRRGRPAKI